MATTTNRTSEKRMEFTPVDFDIEDIAPDAPAGEWRVTIPRGKIKVQGTKEGNLPMLVVPIRLEGTSEDGGEFEKALGTELTSYLVFGSKSPKGDRMAKLRIRQLCERADIDLDVLPKRIESADDFEPFIRALEGKKFTAWTVLRTRKDTGEVTTELQFQDPKGALRGKSDDDDGDEDEAPESRPQRRPEPARGGGKNGARRR